ncbi:MAG: DUF3810 domain-containing protein [Clostridia bacterium]|nr:DUF3810 domain-containing protein [Clostridia bacterium]
MKNTEKRAKIPIFAKVCACILIFSVAVHIASALSVTFADFFNFRVAVIFRRALAYITNILPFSVAEMLIYLLPVVIFVIILYCVHIDGDKVKGVRLVCTMLAVISLFYSSFVLTLGTGYHTKRLGERLGYSDEQITAADLQGTAKWLADELYAITPLIEYGEDGASVMPYSFSELNDRLISAYERAEQKYPFIDSFYSRTKEVMSGEYMSHLRTLGVYTYFTGEANVNTTPPDYDTPYTMAHEMAHQRGIAREDEANFVAFLVCIEAEDEYIRYSGYLNVFEYVSGALYETDPEAYMQIPYPAGVYYDRLAYREYYYKYSDTAIGDVSNKINDAYLKAQGTEGRISYDLVTTLAVGYFKSTAR